MMMISRNSNSGGVLVILFVALLLACCSTNNSNNRAAMFVVAVSCNSTSDGVAPCVDIIDGDTGDTASASGASSFTGKALTTEAGVAVEAFLGIQYATQARFEQSTVKLTTTPEDEDATVLGPSCPQLASVWSDASDTEADEDCLYLNIWRPSSTTETDQDAVNNTTTTLLPVMVWIHGGAYIFGSGNNPNFDGANLAGNEQVIVITINYRLNVFGYMPFENDESASGSGGGMNGILDQIRALEWIQSRIEDFGGDPKQVTIFGESAGAISVCQLSVIPEAKGLFLRGIMESGSCDFLAAFNKTLVDQAIATSLPGCDDEGTVCGIDDLKKFSVQELLNITVAHDFFKPVWDPAVISTPHPAELYADSTNINPMDLIIGSNTKDDYNLVFYTEKNAYLNHSGFDNSPVLSQASPQVKNRIVELYADKKYGDSSVSAYAEFHGDFAFGCSSRLIATTAASSLKEGNVYFYSFGRLSPFDIAYANGLLQGPPKNIENDTSWASHEGEIPFVFGNPTQLPNLDPVIEEIPVDFDEAEKVLVKEIQSRWATFAKSGLATAPATDDDDEYDVWSVVSPEGSVAGSLDPAYMSFGDTGGVMVLSDDNKNEQCTAMLDVYASLGAPATEGEETEESEGTEVGAATNNEQEGTTEGTAATEEDGAATLDGAVETEKDAAAEAEEEDEDKDSSAHFISTLGSIMAAALVTVFGM